VRHQLQLRRRCITVLKSEDAKLKAAILTGAVSLLAAGQAMRPMANLLAAYRAADRSDKVTFSRVVSLGTLWDEIISPVCHDNPDEVVAAAA
jgi:hypothetical protein